MAKLKKHKAVFKGGDYDGKALWLDKPHPTLVHVSELKTRTGYAVKCQKAKYKLVSDGPPLTYEVAG